MGYSCLGWVMCLYNILLSSLFFTLWISLLSCLERVMDGNIQKRRECGCITYLDSRVGCLKIKQNSKTKLDH